MYRFFLPTLLMGLLFGPLLLPAQATYAPDRVLLRLHEGFALHLQPETGRFGQPTLDALAQELGVQSLKRLLPGKPRLLRQGRPDRDRLLVLTLDQSVAVPAVVARLAAHPLVAYAEPDFIGQGGGIQSVTPDDTWYGRQWSHDNDGSFNGSAVVDADIDLDKAWTYTTGDSSILAVILDSGGKLDHPEFAGRIWTNAAEVPGDGIDNDGNGRVDDVQGWDFANDDSDPTDDQGHGTNVGGILGATGDNATGYAGVDWHCQLMFGKILNDQNSGFYSWWTSGIYYAVDQGADVINMSVGGASYSQAMKGAVNYAYQNGVIIVACMMNFDNSVPQYPATYANTIAVGATDVNDHRVSPFFWSVSSGSNYGPHIDLSAPGNYIYGLKYDSNTNYGTYWGGTSQATPLVAGVASLLKGIDRSLDTDSIRSILRFTAQDMVGDVAEDLPGFDDYHGAGRLNANLALSYVLNRQAVSICEGDNYLGLTQSGTYPQFVTGPDGDDSLFVVELAVLSELQGEEYMTICFGESYAGYSTPGTYIDTLQASTGCDSIRTLNLFINPEIRLDSVLIVADSGLNQGQIAPFFRDVDSMYSYTWDHGPNTRGVSGLGAGEYGVTVSTRFGCSAYFSFTVAGVVSRLAGEAWAGLQLYPQPVAAGQRLSLEGLQALPFRLQRAEWTDQLGRSVATQAWAAAPGSSLATPKQPGLYFLRLVGEKGQSWTRKVLVSAR